MSDVKRYRVVKGSQSAHCCFEATVVDTAEPVIIAGEQWVGADGEPQWRSVCECFDEDEAGKIATALNCVPTP